METVEIPTDVLPEAMLKKLGLPCPKTKSTLAEDALNIQICLFCQHLFLHIMNFG
jgi:hypothetical protein